MILRNDKVKIIVDSREAKTRIPHLLEKRCNIEQKQLTTGDYILSGDVCVERKTISDFVSSVMNRRLFEQMAAMKETYPCPILILEGKHSIADVCDGTKINPNAICGAIISLTTDYQMPVLHTKDQRDTANMLYLIARREQEGARKSISIRQKQGRSDNERQEYLIAGLPLVDKLTAERLLKHFGTPERIFAASMDELQKVDGIGREKAKKIREMLTRGYERSVLD